MNKTPPVPKHQQLGIVPRSIDKNEKNRNAINILGIGGREYCQGEN